MEHNEPALTKFRDFHAAMLNRRVQCRTTKKIMNSIEFYSLLMWKLYDNHHRCVTALLDVISGDDKDYKAVPPPPEPPAPVVKVKRSNNR
jgi:hypothetical protein